MKEYNAFLRWARETAIALMQEIDKEYHFKNNGRKQTHPPTGRRAK